MSSEGITVPSNSTVSLGTDTEGFFAQKTKVKSKPKSYRIPHCSTWHYHKDTIDEPEFYPEPRNSTTSYSSSEKKTQTKYMSPSPMDYHTTTKKPKGPMYSFGGEGIKRDPFDKNLTQGPGPGNYKPENSGPSAKQRAPAYTFGNTPTVPRGPVAAMYTSPGPQYGLPANMYRDGWDGAPHYSFGTRHWNRGRKSIKKDLSQH